LERSRTVFDGRVNDTLLYKIKLRTDTIKKVTFRFSIFDKTLVTDKQDLFYPVSAIAIKHLCVVYTAK
jgi:hypothetical protein